MRELAWVMVAGAGCGLGLYLVVRATWARPSLTDVGATLSSPGRPAHVPAASSRALLEQRVVGRVVELLRGIGLDPSRRATDLRVARRSVEQHVLAKLSMALVCGMIGAVLALVLGFGGAGLLVALPLLGAGLGFLVPELTLSSEARESRRAFRHAYGAYLDLVNVMLAAGAGPESALHIAADSGAGWAFVEIRNALAAARATRKSIADAMGQLGDELEVSELNELAASVALVGSQGARIRASLTAKADSLRSQQVSETEAQAESATERMTIPVVVLLFGFLLFLAYPAVVSIAEIGGGGG
jgi:tight adherence protein C